MTATAKFAWPEGHRAALSFSFDDARLSQADIGLPLFEKLGVPASWYVSIGAMEKRLPAWRKAVADGHEIGNHTMSHPCTGNFAWSRGNALENRTLDDMAGEMDEANTAIEQALGVKPTTFAYPCGNTFVGRGPGLKSYIPLVAERFKVGRGWLSEAYPDPVFCDLSWVAGFPLDNLPFEAIKSTIDQGVAQSSWVILVGHEINQGGRQTSIVGTIEAACRYAQDHADGIWIDTVAKVGQHVAAARTGLNGA